MHMSYQQALIQFMTAMVRSAPDDTYRTWTLPHVGRRL